MNKTNYINSSDCELDVNRITAKLLKVDCKMFKTPSIMIAFVSTIQMYEMSYRITTNNPKGHWAESYFATIGELKIAVIGMKIMLENEESLRGETQRIAKLFGLK